MASQRRRRPLGAGVRGNISREFILRIIREAAERRGFMKFIGG